MASRTVGPQGHTNTKTYTAEGAGLTRGLCMKAGANVGGVNLQTAAGGQVIGILAESTIAIGDPAAVVRDGDTPAIAGAAIAYGAYVKSDAAGRVIPITGTAGEQVVGRAESATAALGDELIVFVKPFVY